MGFSKALEVSLLFQWRKVKEKSHTPQCKSKDRDIIMKMEFISVCSVTS